MGGIFGICKLNGDQIQISDMKIMASMLRHRGPDDAAYTLLNNNTVGLGHLGLMSAENRPEPQPLFNADYSVCITCDGTIYDSQKIRARLWDLGIRLNADSAAEMILYLYEAFGMEFTKFLNGEFAFVIYDQRTRRMIAARDHIGIRPMYYKEDTDELMFASEAKSILALSRVERRISNQYLAGVHVGTIPADGCAFDGITCLKPAHLLVIEDTEVLPTKPYWNLSFKTDFTMSRYDAEIEIRQSLQRAVERRLVPRAGVLLSGGLDSTLVCGIMAQSGADMAAYSVGFTQDSDYDESATAARIADYYGVPFHALDCPMVKLSDQLMPTVFHTEMGISNPGAIARFLMSDWVRSHHTNVCLTGEGADEFFGGYAYFKLEELWRMLESDETDARVHATMLLAKFKKAEKFSKGILWDNSRSWRKADRLLRHPSFIEMRSHHASTFVHQIFNTEALRFTANDSPLKIFEHDIYDPIMQSMDPFNVCRMLSIAQLSGFILPALGDRVEMAHGLECREPFLDLDLIELSARIPPKYFLDIDNLSEKDLLKRSTKSLLPEFLAGVHKHPFYSNHWRAFIQTQKGHQIFDALLSQTALKHTGIFNTAMLKIFTAAWRTIPERSLYFKRLDAFIGFALSTQAISQMFIENRPAKDLSFPITERPNYFDFKGIRSRQVSVMSSQSL